jgi:hypothetical protein
VEPLVPNYLFKHVCVDFMSLKGHQLSVCGQIYRLARGLLGRHRVHCDQVPGKIVQRLRGAGQLHLGQGPNLTAKVAEDMMRDYGIHQGISSVANPHTNARAELGVKTVKRMLRDNLSARGTLDRGRVSRALLQLRNTPDKDTKLSLAKAL